MAVTKKTIKTMDTFKALYPKPTIDKMITLSPDGMKALNIFLLTRKQLSQIKKINESAKVAIALEIGLNAGADAGEHNIYMPEVMSNKFDSERFQDENEEIYEKYITVSTTRKFDVRVKADTVI